MKIIIVLVLIGSGLGILYQRIMNVGIFPVAVDCLAVSMLYSASFIVGKGQKEIKK
jgi:hypothetical protein